MKTLIVALGLSLIPALAQDRKEPAKGKETTVTGCLQKGAMAFTITDSAGQVYALKSDSVNFDDHLGHRVTVTGTSSSNAHEQGSQQPAGHLDVTKLTMVSTNCS